MYKEVVNKSIRGTALGISREVVKFVSMILFFKLISVCMVLRVKILNKMSHRFVFPQYTIVIAIGSIKLPNAKQGLKLMETLKKYH